MIKVIKLSGELQNFDAEKINRVINWACADLDVSESEIAMKAHIQVYDGMTTNQIHDMLIKSASDLITVEEPDYQYAAARLLLFKLRKDVYGDFDPPALYDHIQEVTELGWYDEHILQDYSEEDINYLETVIQHERDFDYTYVAMKQYQEKYLVKNRVTNELYETPQMAIMLISMCLHSKEKENRLQKVAEFYDAVSNMEISLPTPIMAGVRTPTRQFSSCVLIESGDDIDQIFNASAAQGKYAAQRAGIGINIGGIRGTGAPIRGGEVSHAGLVPIVRMFQESLGWASQGGIRKASATYFYPIWHYDYNKLIVLKNNRGTEESRARHVDYGVQLNRLFYKRLQENKSITLFHPNVAGGKLYEYFFSDQERFEELYEALEKDKNVIKQTIPAIEAFSGMGQERAQTGRIYIQNVDHCNTNSPFIPSIAPVKQSNLCLEIALPTSPINDIMQEEEGEIALCTLLAFNLGKIKSSKDFERLSNISVRALDNLLDYQNYPVKAAEKNKFRRSLGIGWTNLAYFLAKKGLNYSSGNANNTIHELAEAFQFYLLKASNSLAKERGACKYFNQTTYSQGILPIDRYKKTIDNYHTTTLKMNWEELRSDIKEYGLRNSTLSALMPCETSSQITNSTNGIEPPRAALSIKASGDGSFRQLVPEVAELKDKYEYKWDMKSPKGYLTLCGIIQKFIDQSISANTFYCPWEHEGGKLSVQTILEDILFAYSLGMKTLYYQETKDNENEAEDDCESCKI